MLNILFNDRAFVCFYFSFVVLNFHFLFLDLDFSCKLVGLLLFDLGFNSLYLNFLLDNRHLLGCLLQFYETSLVSLSVFEEVASFLAQHTLEQFNQLEERFGSRIHISFLLDVELSR